MLNACDRARNWLDFLVLISSLLGLKGISRHDLKKADSFGRRHGHLRHGVTDHLELGNGLSELRQLATDTFGVELGIVPCAYDCLVLVAVSGPQGVVAHDSELPTFG